RGRLVGEPGAGGIAGSPRNRQGATYSVWSIPAIRKRRTPERISRPVCTWDTPGEDLAGIGKELRAVRRERRYFARRVDTKGFEDEVTGIVLQKQFNIDAEPNVARAPQHLAGNRDGNAAHFVLETHAWGRCTGISHAFSIPETCRASLAPQAAWPS